VIGTGIIEANTYTFRLYTRFGFDIKM